MANGGHSVQPYVAQLASGTASPAAGTKQLISSSLSGSLTGLMEHVVTAVPSYNQATYIPGYFVGGKTGTAQIWDASFDKGKGGWLPDVYNFSFYGWVGHSSPDLAVGVVIYHGALTDMPIQSTELFRRVATDSVVDLHIEANKDGPVPPPGRKAKSLG